MTRDELVAALRALADGDPFDVVVHERAADMLEADGRNALIHAETEERLLAIIAQHVGDLTALRALIREVVEVGPPPSTTPCNCGYGGFHEELNPRCDRNNDPVADLWARLTEASK